MNSTQNEAGGRVMATNEQDDELKQKVIDMLDACYADRGAYQSWQILPHHVDYIASCIAQHTKEAVERGALRARKQGYDPNLLGSWIFIGDNEQLNNLDDLYWSYVTEFCVKQDPYRIDTPYADTERWKRMMPSASFGSVGEFKMLARADQYAKERIAELSAPQQSSSPNEGEGGGGV